MSLSDLLCYDLFYSANTEPVMIIIIIIIITTRINLLLLLLLLLNNYNNNILHEVLFSTKSGQSL